MRYYYLLLHACVIGIRPCPYDGDHRCGDGRCIRLRHVCNGYENCDDGSDEIGCRKYTK